MTHPVIVNGLLRTRHYNIVEEDGIQKFMIYNATDDPILEKPITAYNFAVLLVIDLDQDMLRASQVDILEYLMR
jgi:hypothetical protein|tara:strand:+ start:610 stop:831 length:222 start_codon:yes stop_codon:yes gene_type:complete